MKELLAEARRFAVDPLVCTVLGYIEQRCIGLDGVRSGRTRQVLVGNLLSLQKKNIDLLAIANIFISGLLLDLRQLPQGARDETVFHNNNVIEGDFVESLYEDHQNHRGIYDIQIYIEQPGSRALNQEEEAKLSKLGFCLPAQRGDNGVRDTGKTRQSFRHRLRQYYTQCENQRGKFMCSEAGILQLGCEGLKFGYFMIPVWIPMNAISEQDEEQIYTVMECLWDCVSHSGPNPGNDGPDVQRYRGTSSA
jgi:hypothetical protein